ncbi:coproporphyrinogen III oxidase [Macrococcus hajekii]|uniref:Coproporphyrinogen III oxidase n=1 Tax=Macrococcus hajekii TaxID=198482 RepID=A0A4V3BE30_9STAP|nr:coproporphyrinogen III oxidase [Macrococcus hajekii]TDM02575.1 coproporphyrinogen III oxidase [Macrococcus hajekii]GGB02091.1 oxygen-independent coproporphyrinogen-III oxidase-like protein HemZ [Macrococcus hajekii]
MKIFLKNKELENNLLFLQNIINLYFEDSFILIGEGDNQLYFDIESAHEVSVTAHLILEGGTYKASARRNSADKKQMKQAIAETLVTVLTAHTGIIQSWGTLTGIRPTKLYHRYFRQGLSHEAISDRLKTDYLISQEKLDLMQEIVHIQNVAIPDLYDLRREVSIYIGIPFCPTKCAYCTFPAYSILVHKNDVPEFLVGLLHEIAVTGKWLKDHDIKVTTIYFGGGTPTSITPKDLKMLLEQCYASFDMTAVREVTVEAGRPDTIDEETLRVLNDFNIDRISINPQSFTDETLKAIGRHHSVQETIDKFKLARTFNMNNINMDLIIGLPNENRQHVQHSLEETQKLRPESLTVHTLSFKRASEMTRNKEKYPVAQRDEIMHMMDMTRRFAAQEGYKPYYLYRQKNILGNLENIGYSIEQEYSLYNILIMEEMQTILGIGCGASSKFIHPKTGKIENYLNPKDPKSYNKSYEHYTEEKINKLNEIFKVED